MGCPAIPELDFGIWGAELQSRLVGRRYPLSGLLELTDRCNLHCVHCYINQPVSSQAARSTEMTTEQIKNVLEQVAGAGCLFLILTGGEILARPDFAEIYQHARRQGLVIGLFTNATMITPGIADLLARERPQFIDITLYGATQENYERITGIPGSYDRCVQGIDLLLERDLPVFLKTSLISINRPELDAIKDFAAKRGIKHRFDSQVWPRLDGSEQPFYFQLSIDEILEIDKNDPERRQEWIRIADQFGGAATRSEQVYSCGAALQIFHIDSTGRISGCTMSRQPSYSLLQMSFDEAWAKLGEIRSLKRQQDNQCRTCTLGGICQQCPAWSQAVHGDNETIVDFLCDLAHARAAQIEEWQYNSSIIIEENRTYE